MQDSVRFPKEAWVPLLAGLSWLWIAPAHGLLWTGMATLPGCLLTGSGVAMLLWPGDARITHYAAAGGLLGALLAIPGFFVAGFGSGLLLMGLSVGGFIAAGGHAMAREPKTVGVPEAIPSIFLSAQVASDEAMLAAMATCSAFAPRCDLARVGGELAAAREIFQSAGWLEAPADYHDAPPALGSPTLRAGRTRGIPYEWLSFESHYEPRPDEPGRDRWLSYTANRTAHAWVLRHRAANRPWLCCISGYRMGQAPVDLLAFPPAWLHHDLGFNLLIPVLPLHGLRKSGRRSGDGFLAGDILDSIHAQAQAVWDIRRSMAWAREQGHPAMGVLGYSLGSCQAALLASLDDRLACVIAGVPLVDIPDVMHRHGAWRENHSLESHGLAREPIAEVMRVVSPLALEPRLPVDRRFLFAAVADRLTPPDQAHRLWKHWERPRIEWYQGGHLTFRFHSNVRLLIEDSLRVSCPEDS